MNWVLNLCIIWVLHYAKGQSTNFRLVGDVTPTHYDLTLIYDIDPNTNFSFFGAVVIQITANNPVSKIVLHARDINIDDNRVQVMYVSSEISGESGKRFEITNTESDPEKQFYTIFLQRKLIQKAYYQLSIPFSGHLKMHEMHGVYMNHYENKETMVTEYSIVTGFEPIYARLGFPCFDEPQYKATFMVTIGHYKDFHALANMPLSTTSEDNALQDFFPWVVIEDAFSKSRGDFVFDHFEKSKPMSTYLVAFSVSNYEQAASPPGGSSTTTRVWARHEVINQTSYAAAFAPKILSYYENFFNISYHLPKLDHVFQRVHFASGTENWGHINYIELFLLDEHKYSKSDKISLFGVISHEVCHQWFGNLVTMKWWNELWLKEGFATFMEKLSLSHSEDFKRYDGFIKMSETVLVSDALESSLPITSPMSATHPTRIVEIYNDISYSKAAMLIRMLYKTLGEHAFKEAVYNYLVKYSYNSTEQDDLWVEMDEARLNHDVKMRSATVKSVMEAWITQPGYPLITVERDYEASLLRITQKRYLSRESKGRTLAATGWWIPLTVLAQDDEQQTLPPVHWLADNEGTTTPHQFQHKAGVDDWVVFNVNMTALCRVNYDSRNWQLLSEILRSSEYKTIPKFNRAQLIADSFELAKTGNLDYSIPLQLAKFLSREDEVEVLLRGYYPLREIDALLKHRTDYDTFQIYMRSIIEPLYKRYGGLGSSKTKPGEDVELQRQLIAQWACEMNVPNCQKDASVLFEKWMNTTDPDNFNPIPNILCETIYCWGVARGGEENWEFLLERANTATSREQMGMMKALACTREPWLMQRTLDLAVSGQYDSSIVKPVLLRAIQNPLGYLILKNHYYKRNGDFLARLVALYKIHAYIYMVYLVNEFFEQEELDEFLTWRAENAKTLESYQHRLDRAVEQARINIVWLAKHRQLILDKIRALMSENEDSEITFSKETRSLNKKNELSKEGEASVTSLDIKTSKASNPVFMKFNVMCYVYLIGRIAL